MDYGNMFFVLIAAMVPVSMAYGQGGGAPRGPAHSPSFDPSMLHPGCGCSEEFAPVCGTDGRTYSNYCSMMCMHAELAYQGSCDQPQQLRKGPLRSGCQCRDTSFPICAISQGVTYGNLCKYFCYGVPSARGTVYGACKNHVEKQERCRKECGADPRKEPVCGDDGFTYRNKCEWKCMGVVWAHYYDCKPDADHLEYLRCKHCQVEPLEHACGKDDYTYPNRCYLNCRNIELAYIGECIYSATTSTRPITTTTTRPITTTTTRPTTTTDNEFDTDSGSCSYCDKFEDDIVCATDGRTYKNYCMMLICKDVDLVHPGPCETDITHLKRTIPRPPNQCILRCSKDREPVCGVDGVPYINMCWLKCANVEIGPEGSCDIGRARKLKMNSLTQRPPKDCSGLCHADYTPMCGVDGHTYGNMCRLRCAGVKRDYNGQCATGTGQAMKQLIKGGPKSPFENECIRSCYKDYQPVCGANHITYTNACMSKCAKTIYVSDGPCPTKVPKWATNMKGPVQRPPNDCSGLCHADYSPMCGVDGHTYGNMCRLECSGSRLAHVGECTNKKQSQHKAISNHNRSCHLCPMVKFLVCSTDNKTYANTCLLKCSGSRLAHVGECTNKKQSQHKAISNHNRSCHLCPMVKFLVCSTDNKTYANTCLLKCSGSRLAHVGECTNKKQSQHKAISNHNRSCHLCPMVKFLVCSTDNKTYANTCLLKCSGSRLAHVGECTNKKQSQHKAISNHNRSCHLCPMVKFLVCSTDNKTYANTCLLECSGSRLAHVGECTNKKQSQHKAISNRNRSCRLCPMHYFPVCSTENKTYANECLLECSGAKFKDHGPCQIYTDA